MSLTNVISRVSRDDVNDVDANPQNSSVNPATKSYSKISNVGLDTAMNIVLPSNQ